MGAGGDFGHHAAIGLVRRILADHRLGQDLPVAVTSAAALSSHEDSRPRITTSFRVRPFA